MRAAKVQASLRIRAVSPEPSLLAHTSSESRGTFRQKARSLAPLNGWACAVKVCHDGMLEDTNSLDGAHMTPKFPKPGQIKGNPKVHKKGNPLRIIISGIDHPTEKIAEFAEKQLDDYVTSLPSYIKDTTDFINRLKELKQPLPKESIILCMDVKKLYPNIPRKEGLDACREALIFRGDQSMPTEEVLKLIELVLDNNNFQFEDSHCLQIDGTAIGSKLGKNYACTFMATWEEQLLDTEFTPVEYVRFVDDIWGIWSHGEEAPIQFYKRANSIHTRIEVDLRYSTECIEFLDTVTSIEDGYIKTNFTANRRTHINISTGRLTIRKR